MNLQLTHSLYLATGNNRDVYLHPMDDQVCIKIQKEHGDQHNILEAKFLEKHHHKIFPQYYGMVSTNLGDGLAIGLVKDFDGSISKSLEDYVESQEVSESEAKVYIEFIGRECLRNNFILGDDGLQNILLKKERDGSIHPILIDGFGPKNSSFRYVLRELIPPLTKFKTRKHIGVMFKRLEKTLNKLNSESKVLS
ncbi:hypothetical protein GCM10009112_07510 [Marinomonas arenicola]|uniref:YrbL family protein n=1 Tax=Marinomonas TaxID=28253 RepID=UPI00105668E2|nr:YrbL family protein [Marinomonas sp. KMM3893]